MTHKITEETVQLIVKFSALFPKCFSLSSPLPLKTKIHEDLFIHFEGDKEVTRSKIRGALFLYTSSSEYIKNVISHKKRIDLNGDEIEDVKALHVESAQKTIKRREKKEKSQIKE